VGFSGFTAIVNKEMSAKYDTMVNNATTYIESLPWGKDFEVDHFKRPDFTGEFTYPSKRASPKLI
jgi:dipeptidyl-peptidase-3